jgi:hypothetical protein
MTTLTPINTDLISPPLPSPAFAGVNSGAGSEKKEHEELLSFSITNGTDTFLTAGIL